MQTSTTSRRRGWYVSGRPVGFDRDGLLRALQDLESDVAILEVDGRIGWSTGGAAILSGPAPRPAGVDAHALLAHLGPSPVSALGDPSFCLDYGLRAPYVAGAMANGIGSEAVVVAMARAGMLGEFGAAGLPLPRIEAAIDQIQREARGLPWGFNLIHSPNEAGVEMATVALYLKRGVSIISASAFMKLTPALVWYRVAGLAPGPDGLVLRKNKILAKVSRPEVAEPFLRPAPPRLLETLVAEGRITKLQAELAARVPMADDITVEADSGGHTDNRPLTVVLPVIQALRDRLARETGVQAPARIGAAGGLGDPAAVAAAFQLGAAYVLTGTVNQACVEAGTSPMVKRMLAAAGLADVGMAPAGDMFEQGAEVQVLQRGTMFVQRANRLRDWYRRYDGLADLAPAEREELESRILRRPVSEVWAECERFFAQRDPAQLERAAREPRHQMALVFRWYLGLSSRWAIAGDEDRRTDTQIWCGPAIGSFNAWTAGTFLAAPEERRVAVVAANLLTGAASLMRARSLLSQGVHPGPEAFVYVPRPLDARGQDVPN